MSKRQQLTLSHYFQKKPKIDPAKTDTPETNTAKSETRSESTPVQKISPFFQAAKASNVENDTQDDPHATKPNVREANAKRHAEFVEKLNTLETKRRPAGSGNSGKTPPGESGKDYTPLESQVVELKAKYPDVLLAIEVGYKFRFFGEDAKVASKVLHIAHFVDRNFYVASVPTHRLDVHVKRLVQAGHKVGVVRQTETAALKAVGSNRSAPFQRELKHLYTKATYVDEMATIDLETESVDIGSVSRYLLCIVEDKRGGGGPDERVNIGMVAVHPATGDIIYDTFEDGFMRRELETRILHIEPCELLLPHTLSKPTEKVIYQSCLQRSTVLRDAVRIERLEENNVLTTDYNAAFTLVTDFYTNKSQSSNAETKNDIPLSEILRLPDVVIKAIACTIQYLTTFDLQHALHLTKYFHHFSSRGHMLLNGNTVANLEIYRNSTDGSEHGSLFWILDHTRTVFGKRLLRKWVGSPLVDVSQLNQRIDAVEEVMNLNEVIKTRAITLLKGLPDLEKGLSRIHYKRSSPAEVIQVLDALCRVADAFCHTPKSDLTFKSPFLTAIFETLPKIREDASRFRQAVVAEAAHDTECKANLFCSEEQWPKIPMEKENIAKIKTELDSHLEELKRTVAIPGLQYVQVAGIEYLLEVKNTAVKQVPLEWVKISGTKAVSRFHTPFILRKLKECERHRELLAMAAEEAYQTFLTQISEKYEAFRDVTLALAKLDCLFSLATVAKRPNYVKPSFTQQTRLRVTNGRHPMVEEFLRTPFVPNDIDFDGDGCRTMILTGPNMGGKSSYIRQVALISIMGQIGSYVPAESAELGILDAVYTRMGAADNMLAGESTFMVELHETADIMKQATPRSLVILDELGRGTSTHDGMAIAYAVLRHFITQIRSITLFVTHYPSLAELADSFPESTAKAHMSFLETHKDDSANIVFLYKLVAGVAKKSYGLNVARLAELPSNVLAVAQEKADMMESATVEKANRAKERRMEAILKGIMRDDHIHDLRHLLLD